MNSGEQLVSLLATQLENLKERYRDTPIHRALEDLISSLHNNKIEVYEVGSVNYSLDVGPAARLSLFYCPQCKKIYYDWEVRLDQKGYFICPNCTSRLVQAYVGAPILSSHNRGVVLYQPFFTAGTLKPNDYYIAAADAMLDVKCPNHKGLKGLATREPQRPLQTLQYYCVFNDTQCKYYDHGFCKEGNSKIVVFQQLRGGIRRIVSRPSSDLTRPLSVTVFIQLSSAGDVNVDNVKERISRLIPAIDKVAFGDFLIFDFTIMYLLGSTYASRQNRIPIIVINPNTDEKIFLVRKLKTEGLLLGFNWSALEQIKDDMRQRYGRGVDEFEILHSVSHVLLHALTRLTGLSPIEFSESIRIDRKNKIAEVLIYDNSPQGIGGIRAAVSDTGIADFLNYICTFSGPCPRACRSACRACTFYDACPYLNAGLSWRAAYLAVSRSGCP